MTHDRSSAGDPARTLELLWRNSNAKGIQHGPRKSLTVDRIVAAAIELADFEGLPVVTMRRVAQALGIAPMSLYTYVPGKAELLDLMLDSIYAQMTHTDLSNKVWQKRVEALAQENRDLYQQHPWAAAISTSRPPLGPGLMAKYEHELTAFADLGLDDLEMDSALTYLLSFVQASARSTAEASSVQRDSIMSDEQWWAANAPFLARVFDENKYPTATRVGTAAGATHRGAYSPIHAYKFGLQRVIDGLRVFIEGRSN
ncbi:MAG: TetR/AcrR family transcriptional regulator [Candidatus Dormibacteraceae bacterium]